MSRSPGRPREESRSEPDVFDPVSATKSEGLGRPLLLIEEAPAENCPQKALVHGAPERGFRERRTVRNPRRELTVEEYIR